MRLTNTLNIRGEPSKNRFIDINLSQQRYQRDRSVFLKNRSTLKRTLGNIPGEESKSTFDNYLLRANYSHDDAAEYLSYGVGFETNYDIAQGDRIDTESPTILDVGVYTSIEYRPAEQLVLQPMLRYIYNSKYSAPLVPTLNMKYTFGRKLTLRTGISRGFRAPSLKELHFSFIDNNHYIVSDENLQAETSFNSNLTLSYSAQKKGNVFQAELKGFYNNISNMIENVPSEERIQEVIVYYVQNRSRHLSAGADVSFSYFREEASLRLGFSYIGKTSPSSDTVFSGEGKVVERIESSVSELFFSPEFSLNFHYYFDYPGLDFNIFYKFTGEQAGLYIQNGQLTNNLISSYNMLDASFQKKFYAGKLLFSLGAKNLLNVRDIKIEGSLGSAGPHLGGAGSIPLSWGRSFFTSFRVEL